MLRRQQRRARRRLIMISDKVRPHDLQRKAILYVRQSSAHQVLHNRESSALQYAMRDRLMTLGWSVSVRRVLESYESSVIQEWWPDSKRGHQCGRTRTAPVTTAASCAIRAI